MGAPGASAVLNGGRLGNVYVRNKCDQARYGSASTEFGKNIQLELLSMKGIPPDGDMGIAITITKTLRMEKTTMKRKIARMVTTNSVYVTWIYFI